MLLSLIKKPLHVKIPHALETKKSMWLQGWFFSSGDEGLVCKHMDLSLIPRTHGIKHEACARTCHPSENGDGEVEAVGQTGLKESSRLVSKERTTRGS